MTNAVTGAERQHTGQRPRPQHHQAPDLDTIKHQTDVKVEVRDLSRTHRAIGAKPMTEAVSTSSSTRPARAPERQSPDADLRRLGDVPMELSVEIGRTRMTVGETLGLRVGSIVTLDRLAGEAVDLLVNGTLIARGEVVVVDEQFGMRVTQIMEVRPSRPRRRRARRSRRATLDRGLAEATAARPSAAGRCARPGQCRGRADAGEGTAPDSDDATPQATGAVARRATAQPSRGVRRRCASRRDRLRMG